MDDKAEKRRLKKIKEFQKIDELINQAIPQKIDHNIPSKDLQIGFFRLFRFASSDDRLMMIFGSLAALVNGACIPMFGVLYGEVRDALIDSIENQDSPSNKISDISGYFLIIGGICFFTGFIQQYCWNVAGTSQSITIRKQYYRSLFRQDMSWFQKEDKLKLVNRIQTELYSITDGIAEKVGLFLMAISLGVTSLLQSFFTHINMTLILVISIPLLAYPFYYYEKTEKLMEKQKQELYSQAGKIFDQTVQQIKSVKSYNKQDMIYKQYEQVNNSSIFYVLINITQSLILKHILEAKNKSISYGFKLGLSLGLTVLALFFQNGIILYIGAAMVEKKMRNSIAERNTNLSDVVVVFISLLISGILLGQINPFINMITRARQAGGKVFSTIDAMQNINPQDKFGKEIGSLKGHIKLENISFKYVVNNQQYQCIENLSLDIFPGQKVSIIGQSGSGKSSLVNLIMRFYDPQEGSIYIDGENLKDINLKWFRSQIGYVGQEPEIFFGSIKDNLLISKQDATQEELNYVLDRVNLLKLIQSFEKKIDSDVKNLSVGEKQRLCLARVILRKPKIFIFDEPTSSQDFRMERSIQKLIDEISQDTTAIIISHSFSNIQQSDQIIIMNKGKILKQGKHSELIKEDGIYLNIIEEHQYIDEGMQHFMNRKIEEQVNKEAAEEEENQSNLELQSKRSLNHSFKEDKLVPQELIKKQSQQLKKLEKQKKKFDELKRKIKEKMDERFLNLDFGYQSNPPPEMFLFNFGSFKTLDQFKKSQRKYKNSVKSLNFTTSLNKSVGQILNDERTSFKDQPETQKYMISKEKIEANEVELQIISPMQQQIMNQKSQNKFTENMISQKDTISNNNQNTIDQNINNRLQSYPSQISNGGKEETISQIKKKINDNAILINYNNLFENKYNRQIYKFIIQEKEGLKGLIWYIAGIIMCLINGAIYPINSIVIADTILSISDYTITPTDSNKSRIGYSIINFIYTGMVGFLSATIMTYAFNIAGETLSFNLKKQIFKKTLHLPIQWFLKKGNKLGVLSELQNVDTQKLSNLLSVKLSYQFQNFSSIITAMVVSYYFNYRLAIIITVMFPIVIIAGIFIRKNSYSNRYEKELTDHKANEFIQDVILNHKAVASMVFGHEFLYEQFSAIYSEQLLNLRIKAKRQAFLYGLSMFIIVSSQSWFFLIVSRIDFNKYNIRDLFVCILSILYAMFSILENLRYLSDFGSALSARKRILQHLYKNKSEEEIHEDVKLAYQELLKKKEAEESQKKQDLLPPLPPNNNFTILNKISYESTKNTNPKSLNEKEETVNHNMMSLNNSMQDQVTVKMEQLAPQNNSEIYTNQLKSNIIIKNSNLEQEDSIPILEFKQVYFKYPHRENYSLYNISFQIKKGDKVSIVGASGSGKSTIFALVLGFFENYQGQILINGKDIRTMDLSEIRSECRWVQQEPFILQESLQENIIFGSNSQEFNYKRFKQSLGTVCGEDILLKMKDQYLSEQAYLKQQQILNLNSSITKNLKGSPHSAHSGKRSSRLAEYAFLNGAALKDKQQDDFIEAVMKYKLQELSGGQKQKICLARAIYGSGTIYIFDNSTSQLDVKSEKQVIKNLKSKYFLSKTFFQISHRLEPILFSNKLMIINSGRLLEFKNVINKQDTCPFLEKKQLIV